MARLIGFRVTRMLGGQARAVMTVGSRHLGPSGAVHGGILCDLADVAMGMAFASTLTGRESAATVELKINFLRPVWKGRLSALAQVVHRGKRLGLVDCRVSDSAGRLVAKASSTCMVLPRPLGLPIRRD